MWGHRGDPATIAADRDSIPVDVCVPQDKVRVVESVRDCRTDRDRRFGLGGRGFRLRFRNGWFGFGGWRFRLRFGSWWFWFRSRRFGQRALENRRSPGLDVVDPVVVLS